MRFDLLGLSFVSTVFLQTSFAAPILKFPAKGQATFFAPGLGACGGTSDSQDLIVALGIGLFNSKPDGGNPNNNPFCGNKISITHGDNTVEVTVVDACQGCGNADLDLSPAAFSKLAAQSLGRIPISWEFIN